jgi:transcriptional regulator GlxA family with amidase domain
MSTLIEILPSFGQAGGMPDPTRVAIVAMPGVMPFELGAAWEGFGVDRTDDGIPAYDTFLVSMTRSVRTGGGWSITTPHRLDVAADADLVIIPAYERSAGQIEPVLDLLRSTAARGARVMSLCTGAFALGEAGLLDGRDCTTHWRHARALAEEFPRARVNPGVLFVCDGPVLTSAGTAAALDLCLHVIRAEHGEDIARRVARRMVMSPHRDGGQAQYVEAPIRTTPADTLAPLLEQLLDELGDDHTVESLAARSSMSPRTFARRFLDETGTTPHRWLTHQRILRARRLLEAGEDSIETVATQSGFPTAAMLRHHFTRLVGASPSAYRRQFCSREPAGSL